MTLSDLDILRKITDAIEKERDSRIAHSRKFPRLATLSRDECEFLAAVAVRAIRDAGCVFGLKEDNKHASRS